jgi:thiamine-phosphate diphosphorylase
MKPSRDPRLGGIYAIIDNSARSGLPLADLARAAARAGVKAVQLRAKRLPARELVAAAREIAALCRGEGVLCIVNDRLDAALAARADGVHLGQEDLPLAAAREIAGNRLRIGVSTHSVAEARRAEQEGADYVGFGAMYATAGKAKVTAPQGAERLAEVTAAVTIPVIAIGGITRERIPEIRAAGAAGAAVIGAWVLAPEPEAALRDLVRAWQELD